MKALLVFCLVLLALPASASAADYIVSFESGVSRAEQVRALQEVGADPEALLPGRAFTASMSRSEARLLSHQGEVRYVEPDYPVRALSLPASDPQLDRLWGMQRIQAPDGWAKMSSTGEVVVAISDTGIRVDHEDLGSRMWVNADEIPGDGIDNDSNGVVDDIHGAAFSGGVASGGASDEHGHGTHVAGTVAAEPSNSLGVAGVAPYARLMNARFLDAGGSGSTSDGILSIDYAVRNGAKVINCSWGSTGHSSALEDAIHRAREAGVLIVAAAGNNGEDSDSVPFFPAAYPASNVISVAATNSTDQLASFSNFGASSVDLAAPGQMIYSALTGGGYWYLSGTSMASPHVAGAAAVLWGERPGASYWNIRRALLGSTTPLAELSGKTVTGGYLNLSQAIDYPASNPDEAIPSEPPRFTSPSPPDSPGTPNDPAPPPRLRQTKPVVLGGSAVVGGGLWCDPGSWENASRLMVDIVDDNGKSYMGASLRLTEEHAGRTFRCRVEASSLSGDSAVAESNALSVPKQTEFRLLRMTQPPRVIIPSDVKKKKTVACFWGGWENVNRLTVKWVVKGKKVSSSWTLKVNSKLRGKKVYCQVTGYGDSFQQESVRSASRRLPR